MLALPSRLALFSAVIAIVAVSGAALAWDGPTSTTWSAASAIGEYRNEARNLKLAPGWHWPAKLPFSELGDDGERVRIRRRRRAGELLEGTRRQPGRRPLVLFLGEPSALFLGATKGSSTSARAACDGARYR